MINTIRIDHEHKKLIMDRTFAKNAENTRSPEYAHLQSVRRDYPHYEVVRRQIKKNTNKETYEGLTYDYMKNYIINKTEPEVRTKLLLEFDGMILISQCHSKGKRYPTIKKWFLEQFPEIVKFGMPEVKEETAEVATNDNKVVEMKSNSENELPLAG